MLRTTPPITAPTTTDQYGDRLEPLRFGGVSVEATRDPTATRMTSLIGMGTTASHAATGVRPARRRAAGATITTVARTTTASKVVLTSPIRSSAVARTPAPYRTVPTQGAT